MAKDINYSSTTDGGINNARSPSSLDSWVVVGHADSTFRDLGVNVMDEFIGAIHRRKTHVNKEEEWC
jgi:hypothetical protein